MAVPVFRPNQIVRFATSYEEDGDDLTGWRYYLLKEVDKKNNLLILFSITSNHNHRDIIFVSQYKITDPRPPCLQSENYPNSFVNANRLVTVPLSVISCLKPCLKCSNFCLTKEDFQSIIQLHNNLPKYGKKVKRIDLDIKDFISFAFL